MEKQREISFKPLTDGLGFHPFSDGLPYSPQSPSTKPTPTTGTGAVAAGRPTFAPSSPAAPVSRSMPQIPQAPGLNRMDASPRLPQIPTQLQGAPIEEIVDRLKREIASSHQKTNEKKSAPQAPTEIIGMLSHYSLSYTFQRIFAWLIDSAFNLSVAATVLSFAILKTEVLNLTPRSNFSLMLMAVFLFICNWAAIAGQEVAFGTSLGKRVFGMRLPGTGTDAFIRAVAFIPSLLLGGIGIVAAVFDSRKRCLHDRFASLQPEFHEK